jgi:putative hydrolase of the HAD superfamily
VEDAAGAEPAVWAKIAEREDDAGGFTLSPESSRKFWHWVYSAFLHELGHGDRADLLEHLLTAFTRPEAYELYDDAVPTLDRLHRAGFVLGVISNWESWADQLVDQLDIRKYLRSIAISGLLGVEKPDPGIFHHALATAGVRPDEALHVGDDPKRDVDAAQSIGIQGVLLDRASPKTLPLTFQVQSAERRPAPLRIRSLLELPGLLGIGPEE